MNKRSTILTEQQKRVLALTRPGRTAAQVAEIMGVSARTIPQHLQDAYVALGCNNILSAIDKAIKLGEIDNPYANPEFEIQRIQKEIDAKLEEVEQLQSKLAELEAGE